MPIRPPSVQELGKVETDLSGVLAKLTISLTELLSSIRGAATKDFSTVETDLEALLARADIALSALRDGLRGAGIKDFTTLETDVEALLARADIALSAFRDALRGVGVKDLSTLEADVEALNTKVDLFDAELQGAYRSWTRLNCRTLTVASTANGQLVAANQAVPTGVKVVVAALSTNTGVVHVGDGAVVGSVDAAGTRYTLEKGAGIELRVNNLNAIRVRSANGTEQISVTFENDVG